MAWDDVLVAHVSKYTAAIHNEMINQIKARILHSLDTEANGVLVGTGAGAFIFKTLAQFKVILGLGDAAYKNTGSSTGTLCAGDDSRLSNDRNPTAHKSTHATGQSDAIAPSDIGAATTSTKLDDFAIPDDNTDLNANTTNHGLLLKATAPAANVLNVVGIANGETVYTNKALFDSTNPVMDGTAAPGTSLIAAHRDHVHASDTSRVATADIDTDATFAANSDSKVPSQKAVKSAALNWVPPLRTFFKPTYAYGSNNSEKYIFSQIGYDTLGSPANGDYLIIPVFCSGNESIIDLSYYKAASRPIFDLYISRGGDANYILDSSSYDSYASTSISVLISISITSPLEAGWNYLMLKVNGKNASSSGYVISINGVRLR